MDEIFYWEEMMWLQCSGISWLKEGDCNTRFFHMQAKWRAIKNKIKKLKRTDGSWCNTPNEMQCMAREFFVDLFKAYPEVSPSQVLDHIAAKVSDSMNDNLCREFSEKEISDAMFQMRPLKALGPDGFPAHFFQRHWDIMNEDIVAATKTFFHDGVLPEGVNDTAIVLLPKGKDPEELKDFMPISLCNVIYKLISKCIVNNLRGMLDEVVSPEQSAFVPTKQITDNALIAFECVYDIQKYNRRKGDFCVYKLDLSKAYDRVDLGFLKSVMVKLGFHMKFVQWVMTCVTTV
jgi:hypothetical protein